ncbi:MAG: prepilin-type N-terminal cleavage/methylation domain-containing protein [Planctomycetes bacterium]|nr:prepilin-type N-terminal cleavage/methylation domain-containing protein [Planctomycetota bacterium]
MRHSRRFSLLEVIVALGVLAIGATAAFGLLVAAASAGRRAEHQVNASLLAESELNAVRLDPTIPLTDYPLASEAEAVVGEDAPPGAHLRGTQQDGLETRYLVRDGAWSRYPGYRYDIAITPLQSPEPNKPWEFLVELEVRWASKGRRRSARYSTVRVLSLTHVPRD